MTYPIAELLAEAQTWLTAQGDTVPVYDGPEHLKANHDYPRYVWFPDVDDPRGDHRVHGQGNEPRAVGGFREHFQVRCWAADFTEANRLATNMRAALHHAAVEIGCRASLEWEQSRWLRPDERGWVERGRVYILRASIGTRNPDTYDGTVYTPSVVITGVETTGFMVQPTGDEFSGEFSGEFDEGENEEQLIP